MRVYAAFPIRVEMRERTNPMAHLTHMGLSTGFNFPLGIATSSSLVNPQRGIFKPRQMRYLLSIKTVIPKPGGRVWYDDQLEAHDQIYDGDDGIDYAFMGSDPNAADNQWLRAAYENQVGVILLSRYRARLVTNQYGLSTSLTGMQGRSRPKGQPVVPNGLPLYRIHHAAFDAYLVGIDLGYRVHVSDRLLDQHARKMPETLKLLDGGKPHVMRRSDKCPDRVVQHFELFESAV